MTTENTLLGRCTVAYTQALETAINENFVASRVLRTGIASVFDYLATEIAVMLERNPNLTPHQLITILRMEAAGELGGWEQG